jgi:glutaredoxin
MKTCLKRPPRLYLTGEVARQYSYLLTAISVLATMLGYGGLTVLIDESEHYSLLRATQRGRADAFFKALIYAALGPANSRVDPTTVPFHASIDYDIAFATNPHLFFLFALTESENRMPVDSWLAPSQILRLDDRFIERDIQVFVSPSCPYCPQQALAAFSAAIAKPDLVSAEIVEIYENQDLAESLGSLSVPQTFINNTFTTGYIATVFAVFVLMIAFYVVLYYNFENISHYFELDKEVKAVTMQTEMQKKEFEKISDRINQNKIYIHDQKHHINMLNSLLSDQNISEAKKYLHRVEESLNSTVIEQYCDNYVLNVFLSTCFNKAREEQIEIKCTADIPEHLNIDNIELGMIFTNAIENAVNACKKIENPEKRHITVICQERNGQLYIQICNSYEDEVKFNGEFPVTDNKEPGHGIGTRSIASIVKKYGGVFSFTAEAGIFKTTAILNI